MDDRREEIERGVDMLESHGSIRRGRSLSNRDTKWRLETRNEKQERRATPSLHTRVVTK